MALNAARTVRELAIEIPNATRTFEKLGIDYCCGGSRTLIDACQQARVPVERVVSELEQGSNFKPGAQSPEQEVANATLAQLIEHIVGKHHVYVKQELPRLQQLLKKVVAVHGAGHAELATIQQVFLGVSEELSSHMMKEEHILFPYIAALENAVSSGRPRPRPAFGTVTNPVHMMELEHDSAGAALKQISSLSSNYEPPAEACFSYRTLYAALKDFEADLHQHIHLENNILFPRAIAMETGAEVAV
ncbi:MAG TPA: iron-sulfur cluster repair di-iron protein [Candidatus Angelobacter sp.]|nr:iron-sulfur cluster repair di-iron protein [Candidatus Angelobacter sp.]